MLNLEYDASAQALFFPERTPPLFAPGQNWTLPGLCAELSRLAYFDFKGSGQASNAIADACASVGLVHPLYFNDAATGAQAFAVVSANGKQAYVAFRGTELGVLLDLLADADARLLPWRGGGRAHAGFARAYMGLYPAQGMSAKLLAWRAQYPGAMLYLTGHSLGAAIATLAASSDFKDAALITFGSPKVGDADFVSRFTGRDVSRYVDCCDVVATVPLLPQPLPSLLSSLLPASLLSLKFQWPFQAAPQDRYRHLKGRIYIDRDGKVRPNHADAAIALDCETAERTYRYNNVRNVPARFLADHAMLNYIRAL